MRRSPRWFIEQIADLMVRGAWISGRSRKKLAQEWGVPVSTVANYAAEASKLVHNASSDDLRDELKATSLERLQTLSLKAEQAGRHGDAVRALRVVGEMTGLISTKPNAPLVVVNMGGKPERIDASEVARFAERAHAFMAERHPELVAEFLEYVGAVDTDGEVVR